MMVFRPKKRIIGFVYFCGTSVVSISKLKVVIFILKTNFAIINEVMICGF